MPTVRKSCSYALLVTLVCCFEQAHCQTLHQFETLLLTEEFHSEGACYADINGDGVNDVVSGPYWYRGPDFRTRREYAPAVRCPIKGYSDYFFTFADDFNNDGRPDILAIGMPGQAAYWFENPFDAPTPEKSLHWKKRLAVRGVGNESPTMADIDGDGVNELVCIKDGAFGSASPNRRQPDTEWVFTPVTDNLGFGAFTHGMGVGDVNGDGRLDLLETNGWWEQTSTAGQLFTFHRQRFSQSGGAQMFAVDMDGDGDNDVVSTQNAHGYGLSWFEQTEDGGQVTFVEHPILTDKWQDNAYGLAISQMHAVAIADMDGDGVKDIITGKRYWAHGGNDPGSREANVLYWLRTVRTVDGVRCEPWLIDDRSGVGTQLTVGDLNGDGLADVVAGNKLGTFVSLHSSTNFSRDEFDKARPKPQNAPAQLVGTQQFVANVRETNPLSPADQERAFILPTGFDIDLVAADPVIGQPMNLAFDGRGRLWVSSSLEYPFGAADGTVGRDTIKIFEDTDDDGTYDKVVTFADELNIPIGLLPYKNGVICFSIPNIWYLDDTDGDDRADKRTKLYGPFDTTRDTHGMCNSFLRGADGWVYACHGFNNQSTVAGSDGHPITMQSGNVFRFRPDGSRIEIFTHGQVNPFGMTVDRFGDILTADCHTKPINLLLRGGYHDSFGKPHDGLGYIPNVMEHLHGSTGIGGIALGTDTNFPDVYRDSSFGCNVVTSRVNRNTLLRGGSSIQAQEEPDFLTSHDPWFRPVYNIVGPDGALYIADFYNAIIGHYEVDLFHPKRDRHLGRVWRVSYKPTDARRDSVSAILLPRTDLKTATLPDLIAELQCENGTRARLAIDQITDRFPGSEKALRDSVEDAGDSEQVNLLWCLHRLGALTSEDVTQAVNDDSSLVRVHGLRMLESNSQHPGESELLIRAFSDPKPLVRRAAVMAAVARPDETLIRPLLALQTQTPTVDVHLHHAIQMALGHHLRNDDWFQRLIASGIAPSDQRSIVELCDFLKSAAAGQFLVGYLTTSNDISADQLGRYLQLAVRHVDDESAAKLVSLVANKFDGDRMLQLELLNDMRIGLERQSKPIPLAGRQLAVDIANRLFELQPGETLAPTSWKFQPHPESGDLTNPWMESTRRNSADGVQQTPLWSSFPKGETLTGIFRSSPFVVPETISFYIAGHDGEPSKPIKNKNFVRLRDAATGETLRMASPMRNDVAQPVEWDTGSIAGRKAYIELVDGDTATAYAWLAVGRFSIPELNPSQVTRRRQAAARVIADFKLQELRPLLVANLPNYLADVATSKIFARSLVALADVDGNSSSIRRALAEAIDIPQDLSVRQSIAKRLMDVESTLSSEDIVRVMSVATFAEQSRIAEVLATDASGATLLVDLAERGVASSRLLADEKRAAILFRLLNSADRLKAKGLIDSLPNEDARLAERISTQRQMFDTKQGSPADGRAIFEKQCMICHQVGGMGKSFAPNLDGIGNRGLDRLLEDVLAPNRNVDVAFRAQTIITLDGQVFNGLVKDGPDEQIRLIESNGNERLINAKDIDEQIPSVHSPMPANFAETLTPDEFLNLISYVLSLTNS